MTRDSYSRFTRRYQTRLPVSPSLHLTFLSGASPYGARINLLIARAAANECDLIVRRLHAPEPANGFRPPKVGNCQTCEL